ncbi:DUF2971 domain-containing protein [Paraburkholderia sp. BR14263]|uniref:DUF2971 domain-containing protein n=1 Tax=unclassified Paraburkholderia TaxID=2615204 RepID=UPI0034CDEDF6
MEIHHYTKAATLPLILASRKFRFTRADLLDDTTEVPFRDARLDSRFYFVNSWSAAAIDQASQWFQYGDGGRGVCITTEGVPFDFNLLTVDVRRPTIHGTAGVQLAGVIAPFSLETMFGNGYFLQPDAADMRPCFGGKVVYDDNPAQWARQFVTSSDEQITVHGQGTCIARVKSKMWAEQREFRFVLSAIKGPQMNYVDSSTAYEKALLDQFESDGANGGVHVPTSATFIDLPFSAKCLEHLVVTLGPKISAADRQMISAALATHAPRATVRESALPLR